MASDASHKSVPEWAKDKACALFNEFCGEAGTGYVPNWRTLLHGNHPTVIAFAAYIAAHEEAPVDPLLIEAREICSREMGVDYSKETAFSRGALAATYAALRRGIELAGEQK